MKNKSGEKTKVSSVQSQKSKMTNKTQSEASGNPKKKQRGRSIIRLRSHSSTDDNEVSTKKRKTSKSVGPKKSSKNQGRPLKSPKVKSKSNDTGKVKSTAKGNAKHAVSVEKGKSGKTSPKPAGGGKAKSKLVTQKKNTLKESEANHFIDLWSLATIGKREASLNATMKVNIIYERQISPKKLSSCDSGNSKKELMKAALDSKVSQKQSCESATTKKEKLNGTKEKSQKSVEKKTSSKQGNEKDTETSKKTQQSRKRKVSPYIIFEDDLPAKSKKIDNKQTKTPKSKKQAKKHRKSFVLRHHLGNIIERSPRQASLNAKAMIAMEQEDDVVFECAARTRVYDWTEVRPLSQNDYRKMLWVTGHGDPKETRMHRKDSFRKHEKNPLDDETTESVQEKELDGEKVSENVNGGPSVNAIHSTMLKAIHEIGDPRLLREYLRSQKEDIQGSVDIEKCPSPKPIEKPVPPPPSPKKKPPAAPVQSAEKLSPVKNVKEIPVISVPAKPKPCRVATPIPQFPADQKATHMTSFVHHSVPQTYYQAVPQTHPQPQPIKVTPYTSNPPPYVYQYSTDRQQQNVYVPQSNPSALQYGVESNDLSQREFQPSSFSFNHIGSLSLGRRGLNPYHQSSPYTPSIHLPVQAFGFNFPTSQYYQQPLQHLQAQQNMSSLQPCSIQHQYPIVQQPMIPTHPLVQNLNHQLPSYPSGFSPFTSMNPQHINQDSTSCMPPPPPPPSSNPSPQKESCSSNLLPSTKQVIPISPSPTKRVSANSHGVNTNPQTQVGTALTSPVKHTNVTHVAFLSKCTGEVALPKTSREPARLVLNYNTPTGHLKSSFSLPPKHNSSMQVLPVCKKEQEASLSGIKKPAVPVSIDAPNKSMSHFKVIADNSSVSDILHSAHSTMFPAEAPPVSSSERPHVLSSSPSKSCQTQTSKLVEGERNIRFSVSSILDMPTIKVKTEPYGQSCSKSAIKLVQGDQSSVRGSTQSGTLLICIPPPQISKPTPKHPLNMGTARPSDCKSAGFKADKTGFKELLNNRDDVIVIDDSDSSDDEPLVKFVHSKLEQPLCGGKVVNPVSCQSKAVEAKLGERTTKVQSKSKPTHAKEVELPKENKKKPRKQQKPNLQVFTQLEMKQSKERSLKSQKCSTAKTLKNMKLALKNPVTDNVPVGANKRKVAKSGIGNAPKKAKVVKGPNLLKKAPIRRISKTDVSVQPLKSAVHGWSWVGEGEWRPIPKLTLQKEESVRNRMCYRSMKHVLGEVISVKDCVILQSDGDGSVPYVAKVSALWENLNGDMMFSMLWYYQPEHTQTGRESEDGEQELFASKHREENSVACIDDKCYVLMYNEFCRMEADAVRQSHGLPLPRWRELIPSVSEADKRLCRPLPPPDICLDNILFCRYDYDIRKKIVRKPKHKKNDLRYRAPCKLVS